METGEYVSNNYKELRVSRGNLILRQATVLNVHLILAPWNIHLCKNIIECFYVLGNKADGDTKVTR